MSSPEFQRKIELTDRKDQIKKAKASIELAIQKLEPIQRAAETLGLGSAAAEIASQIEELRFAVSLLRLP